jgi:hypothetical protein
MTHWFAHNCHETWTLAKLALKLVAPNSIFMKQWVMDSKLIQPVAIF